MGFRFLGLGFKAVQFKALGVVGLGFGGLGLSRNPRSPKHGLVRDFQGKVTRISGGFPKLGAPYWGSPYYGL